MKNTLLFTTLIAGLALTGCNKSTRTSTADTTVPATDTETVGAKMDRAATDASASMSKASRDVSVKMNEWKLSASDIEADVMANKPVVRTRTDAVTPTGKIDEDTLENAIKGRLHSDAQLANLKFDVNANGKGEVELEGKARTVDQIAHAMAVALDNDTVTKVTSKIKLDPNAGPNRR